MGVKRTVTEFDFETGEEKRSSRYIKTDGQFKFGEGRKFQKLFTASPAPLEFGVGRSPHPIDRRSGRADGELAQDASAGAPKSAPALRGCSVPGQRRRGLADAL